MADTKLSALTALTTTPASDDEVYIRDVSEEANAESKKITTANLLGGVTSTTTFNDHSARHENGGADEINVAGLSGELADNQPPKAHASTHTNGTDDIQLATNLQKGLATAAHIIAIEANTNKETNATHSGEVTGSAALTITNKAVTLAKMADMATSSLIYRKTAGDGVPEVTTLATLKTDLGLTGTNSGDNAGVTAVTGTTPVVVTTGTTPVVSMPAATTTVNGYATTTQITKLGTIEEGAEVNNISDANATDLTDSGSTTLHKHDHGNMDGLGDDDHTQYLKADGTRELTGDMTVTALKKIDGRDVSVDGAKLDTIAENANVTNATTVNSAGAVMESDYDANTILAATSNNTPTAITVAEQTVVGRITSGAIKALTVAELQALILSAALPENVSITLDAALSADGKYCGVTETGTAGTALSFGNVVYFSSSDNKWEKAKGDAATTVKGKVGICVKAAAENASTIILLWGKVRADAIFPTLTVGSPVFISWDTAGLLTQDTPATGEIMRCMGHPNSGDELYVCPDNVYVTVA